MTDLITRARALSRYEHDDASIGDECAAEIERLTADYAAATHLLADRDAQIERLMAELAALRASAASVQADQRAEIDAANAALDELRAAFREDANRLTAERAVLLGLLTDCAAVLRTIDQDDSDEAETLADLLRAIDRAIEPSRHKGALL